MASGNSSITEPHQNQHFSTPEKDALADHSQDHNRVIITEVPVILSFFKTEESCFFGGLGFLSAFIKAMSLNRSSEIVHLHRQIHLHRDIVSISSEEDNDKQSTVLDLAVSQDTLIAFQLNGGDGEADDKHTTPQGDRGRCSCYTLFKMFDDFILLAKGGLTVYHCSVKKIEEYFAGIGINVPERVNPPDYFIDILEECLMIGGSDCFHVVNPAAAHNLEITRFGVDDIEDDVDGSWSCGNSVSICRLTSFGGEDGFSRFMLLIHHPFQVDVTIDLGDHILQGHKFVTEEVLYGLAIELERVGESYNRCFMI
ncbi:hypothetical protein GIB67_040403 [Kingdonia uniflora]|uniref:ABC transporter family G domain-containing protein n=1 Tax=Kingdonia uniflora TaxID=39325 RepID=A0A7J7KXQ9_9MAGN|nr:hypothetical protein GIB67_040403 [Kingdonia uniflora]